MSAPGGNSPRAPRYVAVVVVYAGGHGPEVAGDVAEMARRPGVNLLGAVDDTKPEGPWGRTGLLGPIARLADLAASGTRVRYITALGSNTDRREVVARVEPFERAPAPWTLAAKLPRMAARTPPGDV